jgi:hypothetical protein
MKTLRTLHNSLAADAAEYRRHAHALAARAAELEAELARRETPTEEPK